MCRIIATNYKDEYPKTSSRISRFCCKLQGLVNAEGGNINSPSYDHQTACHFLVHRIQIYSFVKYQGISMNLALQWVIERKRDGVSNQLCIDCLFNRFCRIRSRKISKLCITGLYERNPLTKGQSRGKCLHFMTSSWSLYQSRGLNKMSHTLSIFSTHLP